MNAEQIKDVSQIIARIVPTLTRYQITALALEVIEAVENKSTRGTVPTAPKVEV